jgi:hypothetical protein
MKPRRSICATVLAAAAFGLGPFVSTSLAQPECTVTAGQCCFGQPSFNDPLFSGFAGPIAVATASPFAVGGQVVTVYDFAATYAAPLDSDFPISRYSPPSWTVTNLGSVFGVTLDAAGNIYVTPSTCYGTGVVGPAGWGGIYQIDGSTGGISTFTTAPLPNTGPGLGNIVYDCGNDQFFVTNHEDGKIYRLDNGGTMASSFDHAAPDDGAAFCAAPRATLGSDRAQWPCLLRRVERGLRQSLGHTQQ